MIFYDPNVAYGLFIFWKHAGSVCFCNRVFPQSLAGGLLAAIVCQIFNWGIFDRKQMKADLDVSVFFSSVSTGMAFLIVTRIMLAYSRFWQARGEIVGIQHFLLDTATHMMVFVRLNGDEYDDYKLSWKCHMTNLFNAYFSFVVASLRREDQELTLKQIVDKYDLCLTEEEFGGLELVHCRFHYIESVIVDKWVTMNCMGLVAVPAPFQSQTIRLISEFSDSVQGALMIFGTPFPFPLTQTQGMLQHLFLLCLPLMIGLHITNIFAAALLVFFSVNMVFGLSRISEEMEDPFGVDPNDLPLRHYLGVFREGLEHTVLMRTPAYKSKGSLLKQLRSIQELRPPYNEAKGSLRRLSLLCQWPFAALEDSPDLKTPAFDPRKLIEPALPSCPPAPGLSKSSSSLARNASLAELAGADVSLSVLDELLAKKNPRVGQHKQAADEVVPWKRVVASMSETHTAGGEDDSLTQATLEDEAAAGDALGLLLCSGSRTSTPSPEGSNTDCLNSHAISYCDTDATLSCTPSQRFAAIAGIMEDFKETTEGKQEEQEKEAMVERDLDAVLEDIVDGAVEEVAAEQLLLAGLGEPAPPTTEVARRTAEHGRDLKSLRESLDAALSELRHARDPGSNVVTASAVPAGPHGKDASMLAYVMDDASRGGARVDMLSVDMPLPALRIASAGVEDLLDTNASSASIKNHLFAFGETDDCPCALPPDKLPAGIGTSDKDHVCHDNMLTTKLDGMEYSMEATMVEGATEIEEAASQNDVPSVPYKVYLEMLARLPATLSGHRMVTRQTHVPLI